MDNTSFKLYSEHIDNLAYFNFSVSFLNHVNIKSAKEFLSSAPLDTQHISRERYRNFTKKGVNDDPVILF